MGLVSSAARPSNLTKKKSKSEVDKDNFKFSSSELSYLVGLYTFAYPKKAPTLKEVYKDHCCLRHHLALMDEVFRVLDRNKDGSVSLEEYLHFAEVVVYGTMEEKLTLLFLLIDSNENHILTKGEVLKRVEEISRFMTRIDQKRYYNPAHIEQIFQSDGEAYLLEDDFKAFAMANPTILNCFSFFRALFPGIVEMEETVRERTPYFRMSIYARLGREASAGFVRPIESAGLLLDPVLKAIEVANFTEDPLQTPPSEGDTFEFVSYFESSVAKVNSERASKLARKKSTTFRRDLLIRNANADDKKSTSTSSPSSSSSSSSSSSVIPSDAPAALLFHVLLVFLKAQPEALIPLSLTARLSDAATKSSAKNLKEVLNRLHPTSAQFLWKISEVCERVPTPREALVEKFSSLFMKSGDERTRKFVASAILNDRESCMDHPIMALEKQEDIVYRLQELVRALESELVERDRIAALERSSTSAATGGSSPSSSTAATASAASATAPPSARTASEAAGEASDTPAVRTRPRVGTIPNLEDELAFLDDVRKRAAHEEGLRKRQSQLSAEHGANEEEDRGAEPVDLPAHDAVTVKGDDAERTGESTEAEKASDSDEKVNTVECSEVQLDGGEDRERSAAEEVEVTEDSKPSTPGDSEADAHAVVVEVTEEGEERCADEVAAAHRGDGIVEEEEHLSQEHSASGDLSRDASRDSAVSRDASECSSRSGSTIHEFHGEEGSGTDGHTSSVSELLASTEGVSESVDASSVSLSVDASLDEEGKKRRTKKKKVKDRTLRRARTKGSDGSLLEPGTKPSSRPKKKRSGSDLRTDEVGEGSEKEGKDREGKEKEKIGKEVEGKEKEGKEKEKEKEATREASKDSSKEGKEVKAKKKMGIRTLRNALKRKDSVKKEKEKEKEKDKEREKEKDKEKDKDKEKEKEREKDDKQKEEAEKEQENGAAGMEGVLESNDAPVADVSEDAGKPSEDDTSGFDEAMSESHTFESESTDTFSETSGSVPTLATKSGGTQRFAPSAWIGVLEAGGLTELGSGKLSPYCKIAVRMYDGTKNGTTLETFQTRIVKSTADPVWNESFQFHMTEEQLEVMHKIAVNISCWDRGGFSKDAFLGKVEVNLGSLADEDIDIWLPFQKRKVKDSVSGELHVTVRSMRNKAKHVPEKRLSMSPAHVAEEGGEALSSDVLAIDPSTYVFDEPDTDANIVLGMVPVGAPKDAGKKKKNRKRKISFAASSSSAPSAATTSADAQMRVEVRSASVAKLIERVTSDNPPDELFAADIIYSFRCFCTPIEFLKLLIVRYNGPPQPDLGPDSVSVDDDELSHAISRRRAFENDKESIQACVLRTLKLWNELTTDFVDDKTLVNIAQYNIPSADLSDLGSKRLKRQRSVVMLKSKLRNMAVGSGLNDIPVQQLAQQITLKEFSLMEAIQPRELLQQAWNKKGKEEKAGNVLAYVDWFNRFSRYISTTILREETAELRAVLLNRYIQLGEELRKVDNFNGAIEVLSALHSSPIARLKNSWAILPKEATEKFHNLSQLMDTSGNFQYYRTILREACPPYLPYLGICLTDLTFTDDANDDLVNGLVNVEKQRMVAAVIRVLKRGTSKSPSFVKLNSVRKMLNEFESFDENELFRLSKIVEPKESHGVQSKKKQSSSRIHKLTQSMMNRQAVELDATVMRSKDWDSLFSGAQVQQFEAGGDIMREGEKPDYLYRIKSGTVKLHNSIVGDLEEVTNGIILGEQSLLFPQEPNVITATSVNAVSCYAIRTEDLSSLFLDDPDLFKRFFNHAAQRLAALCRVAASNRNKNKDTRLSNLFQLPVEQTEILDEFECYWSRNDFEMMGVCKRTESYLLFESTLFGFPSREAIPLCSIQEITRMLEDVQIISSYKNIEVRFHDVTVAAEKVEKLQEIMKSSETPWADPPDPSIQIDLVQDPLCLTRSDWDTILDGAKQVTFPKGATIILEGESYQRMYQIIKGSVRIEKIIGGRNIYITSMSASATFGEMSFLGGNAASATCAAETEVVCYIMEGYFVNILFNLNPGFAGRFYKYLATLLCARVYENITQ